MRRALLISVFFLVLLGPSTAGAMRFRTAVSLVSNDYRFGAAVAATRHHIAVGAPGDESPGAVAIYDGTTFERIREVTLGSADLDLFGVSLVSIDEDFLVGAPFLGEVYRLGAEGAFRHVFVRPGRSSDYLKPDPAGFGDLIAAGAGRLVVTANAVAEEVVPGDSPHATLFLFDANTGDLERSVPLPTVCVSGLAADSRLVAVTLGCGDGRGRAVAVFDLRDGHLVREITPPEPQTADLFGVSLSLGVDLLVGAPSTSGGSAYAFNPRTGGLHKTYRPKKTTDATEYHFFGRTVLQGGSWVAVTDPYEHYDTGGVYIFDRRTARVTQHLENPSDVAQYGDALGRFGKLLLLGRQGNPHDGRVDLLTPVQRRRQRRAPY